jgi:hypothetical protein
MRPNEPVQSAIQENTAGQLDQPQHGNHAAKRQRWHHKSLANGRRRDQLRARETVRAEREAILELIEPELCRRESIRRRLLLANRCRRDQSA